MNLKMLRQKKADLIREGGNMFSAAEKDGRALTAQEMARDDAITAELTELDGQIGAAERNAERMRSVPGATDPNAAAAGREGQDENRFGSLGDQLMAVARAGNPNARHADPRLGAGPAGMSESVGSDGGFLVQTDFIGPLLQNVYDGGQIASRIRRIPVGPNSNGIKANGLDENSRANGSRFGGIQAFWTEEGGLKRDSRPKFRPFHLELVKLTGLLYATDELLQDAVALEGWINQAFPEEFQFKVEDAIVNGTGVGMPLGFLNSGATVTVDKDPGQPAGSVTVSNVLNMWGRMPARLRRTAVWLINQELEATLAQLYIPIKNVAGTENVGGFAAPMVSYVPPGVNGNEFGTLMGRPVIPVEYASAPGQAGDLMLVDLSQYIGIDKGGIQSASSIHVRFIYDETTFRFVYRFNGQPMWGSPVVPYRGTKLVSPFVVLGARA